MPKRPPKYSHHKPTGQARVRINGKSHYLGEFDSPQSHKRYESLIAKWLGGTFDADMESLTISRLAILFVDHARQYYRKDGAETSEVHSIQTALRPLVSKCGREKVSQFGPNRPRQRNSDQASLTRSPKYDRCGVGWSFSMVLSYRPRLVDRRNSFQGTRFGDRCRKRRRKDLNCHSP